MQLEYLPNGSPDCLLIRLYDFTPTEAAALCAAVENLASGRAERIEVHKLPGVIPIGGCELVFLMMDWDQGLIHLGPAAFECGFTASTWDNIAGPSSSRSSPKLGDISGSSLTLLRLLSSCRSPGSGSGDSLTLPATCEKTRIRESRIGGDDASKSPVADRRRPRNRRWRRVPPECVVSQFGVHHRSQQPFWIELGRGSGWDGLDTVKLDQTGRVILHRFKTERKNDVIDLSWEVATLQLSPEALAEVLEAVEANSVMGLRNKYHDENVQDGTQWVLWIKQGEQEKSVYFSNDFPSRIKEFAKQLDAILVRAGIDQIDWHRVPDLLFRQHERELWDSINR